MKWNIVHECDNDNGEPTQWACKLTEDGQFVWIDKITRSENVHMELQIRQAEMIICMWQVRCKVLNDGLART